jgi:hypothetical protein
MKAISRVVATITTWTLLLASDSFGAEAATGPASWGFGSAFRRKNTGLKASTSSTEQSNQNKWSSMLDVNPSKILSLMIRHGGLLIPDSIEPDLLVMGQVCHADSIRLNVVDRKLVVYNLTVHPPGEVEDALRVERVYLHWDSYKQPCVDIEVDNVTVLIEFLNLMMTQHNW